MTADTSHDTRVTLRLNGEERAFPDGTTVADLIRSLGRNPAASGYAVAVNDRVVHRHAWPDTALADGDRVELITAAQGG